MITYRSFKKLLGETSLERKCRYLFGAALLGLITGSFWLHAARTRQLVDNQQVLAAQRHVPFLLSMRHLQRYQERSDAAPKIPTDLSPPSFAEFEAKVRYSESESEEPGTGIVWQLRPLSEPAWDDDEAEARRIFEGDKDTKAYQQGYFYNVETIEATDETPESSSLTYFAAIRSKESCLQCHTTKNEYGASAYEQEQLVAIAKVSIPMAAVEEELTFSHAIFVALAIITTGLAMLVAYIIVRYIIVKPVMHLKDVSDAIAMGNLTQRAEITTGDEFEELSHAFNRMLRHMTTVNTELRTVNDNLDAKVDLLAQANMELFNSNRLKDDFLATVSHELRTPLNSILGFSDILAKASNLNDKQHRYVDNIQTSGQNLMTQINDLLDLAKIESGQMEIRAGNLDLQELIDRLVQQITPLAEQKNIDMRVTHPWPALPQLHQDGGKLRQILTNLLSNAIKFTPEGGRVRVSSRLVGADQSHASTTDNSDDRQQVEITVEDTGIGIPMQQQEDIFEKFRQGATLPGQHDHARREYGGTGLGLSIVRELSRLLGGDVCLESEFGKGSVFSVKLPINLLVAEEEPQPTLESPSAVLSRITSVDLMNPTGRQ